MDIQEKNQLFEQFKKTKTFKCFYSTLLQFDESLNCFVATEKWRNKEAELLTSAWWMFEEMQAAKSQAVPEWFDYTKQSPQMDGNYQIFIKGEQITAKWVSRFGFADPIEGDALRQELITHWAMQPQSPKAQESAND